MGAVPVVCRDDAPATIVVLDGERIAIDTPRPEAPGSRPVYRLEDGAEVRIKVHGCKREGETFHIEGRVIDLTRALRDRLLAALASTAPGS